MSHAKLFSASAGKKWMSCPGSIAMEDGEPDKTSEAAAWGTVAHNLCDMGLTEAAKAASKLGCVFVEDGHHIEVDLDMVELCDKYIESLPQRNEATILRESELKVSYLALLGLTAAYMPAGLEEDGFGTADFVQVDVCPDTGFVTVYLRDLKTGRGVAVTLDTPQLRLYALGVHLYLESLGIRADLFDVGIIQPRLYDEPLVEQITTSDLLEWAKTVAEPAAKAVLYAYRSYKWLVRDTGEFVVEPYWALTQLRPTEEGCRWCKAKHKCPALRAKVAEVVADDAGLAAKPDDFANLEASDVTLASGDWLSACLSAAPLIEDWIKALYAEADRRILEDGATIKGFKVVQGRAGARKWSDPEAARALLRDVFRLPESAITEAKLKTPTQMLKLAEGDDARIGPRQLPKLEALIIRAEGQPRVVRESDPRKPVQVIAQGDMFSNLNA